MLFLQLCIINFVLKQTVHEVIAEGWVTYSFLCNYLLGHQHHKPELKELCHYSEAVSSCWKELALELDLPYETINTINIDHDCIKNKCYYMFNAWLHRSDACWCHIVKALKMIKMLQLAKNIEESFLSM